MAITNNNLALIDRPMWEQLNNTPTATAAGSCMDSDGYRFIYVLFSATNFWRYDTWADTWQQLASPPSGTCNAGSCIEYTASMGTQTNGVVYGSVYAFQAQGSSVTFFRYDIGTNAWTSALSVTNVAAAFATNGAMIYPGPKRNGWAGGYHSAVALNTITASGTAAAGATSISVNALPLALPANAVLNFGTLSSPVYAVLTASAAANATSITVSALNAQVTSGSVAYFYADLFLIGNNATQMYRYNIAGNAWTTTSANSGTPALASLTAAAGAGCNIFWLPGSGEANALDRLIILRSTATGTIYEYSLTGNTVSTLTYYPFTETFTTGTTSCVRSSNTTGKKTKVLIQKEGTGRISQFDRNALTLTPQCTQGLIAGGTATVGNKMCCLWDPTNSVEYCYTLLNTSSYFLRTGLFF